MSDKAHRKELWAQYKEVQPEAGVYRIVNRENNKTLVDATADLATIRNKFAFYQTTKTAGALDYRLRNDIRAFGIAAFTLEVLEVLETDPQMTREEIRRDLTALLY